MKKGKMKKKDETVPQSKVIRNSHNSCLWGEVRLVGMFHKKSSKLKFLSMFHEVREQKDKLNFCNETDQQ